MNPMVGIAVFVFNKENKVCTFKRKNVLGAGLWSLPGGHLEFLETFEECIKREIFEEIGIQVNNIKKISFVDSPFKKENKHYVTLFFKATAIDEENIINKEPEKHEDIQWVSLSELKNRETFESLSTILKEVPPGWQWSWC